MLASRLMVAVITFSLIASPTVSYAQSINLPVPGTMLTVTSGFTPTIVRGLSIYPDNPLQFDFIIDTGDENLEEEAFSEESTKLIKYFLATLTVPEDEQWVNLSPYEKDRVVPESLGETVMGRDLLAQDYILKQLSASLMYPEDELGQQFWQRVYKKAFEAYGTTEIPMNTFNKIWIVPDKAVVYEHDKSVFVIENHLKVMLEEDYLALEENLGVEKFGLDNVTKDEAEIVSGISSEVVREILIPEIEKEVNEGQNFATLRQIYNSMLLATWYKRNLKETLLGKVYIDQNKIKGVDVKDKQVKQKIYDQYVEAFKKGVYNYIREDYDPVSKEMIPRKYFSGGTKGYGSSSIESRIDMVAGKVASSSVGKDKKVTFGLIENLEGDISSSSIFGGPWTVKGARKVLGNYEKYDSDKLIRSINMIGNNEITSDDVERFKLMLSHFQRNIRKAVEKYLTHEQKRYGYYLALSNENLNVREKAVSELGDLKDKRAVIPLIKMLSDEDRGVKMKVIFVLGELGDKRAVDPLIKMLWDKDWYVILKSIYALAKLGDKRAVVPLNELLLDGNRNKEIKIQAAEALGKLGDKNIIDPIVKMLSASRYGEGAAERKALDSLVAMGGYAEKEARKFMAKFEKEQNERHEMRERIREEIWVRIEDKLRIKSKYDVIFEKHIDQVIEHRNSGYDFDVTSNERQVSIYETIATTERLYNWDFHYDYDGETTYTEKFVGTKYVLEIIVTRGELLKSSSSISTTDSSFVSDGERASKQRHLAVVQLIKKQRVTARFHIPTEQRTFFDAYYGLNWEKNYINRMVSKLVDNGITPVMDNVDMLRFLGQWRVLGYRTNNDWDEMQLAIEAGADILIAAETLSVDKIKRIKQEYPKVVIITHIQLNDDIEEQIRIAVENGVDGVQFFPIKDLNNQAFHNAGDIFKKVRSNHPDLIISVAGGVFQQQAEDILLMPENIIPDIEFNYKKEIDNQLSQYKRIINESTAARLIMDKLNSNKHDLIRSTHVDQVVELEGKDFEVKYHDGPRPLPIKIVNRVDYDNVTIYFYDDGNEIPVLKGEAPPSRWNDKNARYIEIVKIDKSSSSIESIPYVSIMGAVEEKGLSVNQDGMNDLSFVDSFIDESISSSSLTIAASIVGAGGLYLYFYWSRYTWPGHIYRIERTLNKLRRKEEIDLNVLSEIIDNLVNIVKKRDFGPGLLIRYSADNNKNVRFVVAEALKKSGVPPSKIVKGHTGGLSYYPYPPNGETRANAVLGLGRMGYKEAIEPLKKMLSDEDSRVRKLAGNALRDLGVKNEDKVKTLIKMLGNEDSNIKKRAIVALGEFGDKQAVEPLIKLLMDKDDYVRMKVIEVLGKLRDERAVEPLIELLSLMMYYNKYKDKKEEAKAIDALDMIGWDEKVKVYEMLDELKAKHKRVDVKSLKMKNEQERKEIEKMIKDRLKKEGSDISLFELEIDKAIQYRRGGYNFVVNFTSENSYSTTEMVAVNDPQHFGDYHTYKEELQKVYKTEPAKLWISQGEKLDRASSSLNTSNQVGGINLNPATLDLQIKRDGNGVPLPLNLQPIGDMNIEGFTPFIIQIVPVTNLPQLLGLTEQEEPLDSAQADGTQDLSFTDKYREYRDKPYLKDQEVFESRV